MQIAQLQAQTLKPSIIRPHFTALILSFARVRTPGLGDQVGRCNNNAQEEAALCRLVLHDGLLLLRDDSQAELGLLPRPLVPLSQP